MKIDVFDSYATSKKGHEMHFDVLVPAGTSQAQAYGYGQAWLRTVGESPQGLHQERCNFCHTEKAEEKVQAAINEQGYYVLQMQGCPEPM